MRAATICLSVTVLLLVCSAVSHSVQPGEIGENERWIMVDVLCGQITEDTMTNFTFYVTCLTTVQPGVRLEMLGMGYADWGVKVKVYGTLYFSAYMTWNTTDPQPDPIYDQWWGISVYPGGKIEAIDFEMKHSLHGLWVGSDSNTIRKGLVQDSVGGSPDEGYGISVSGNNNTVEDVTFRDVNVGVELSDDGHGNIVRNSRFFSLGEGVRLGGRFTAAANNTVVCNEFMDNYMNIYVPPGSTGNRIHHNNFYATEWTVVLDESRNIWDDGYPNGGNYWLDYVGNDSHRGVDQNFPGADGIGDEPYNVPSWALDLFDNYPFKDPVSMSGCPSPPPQMPKGPIPPYNLSANLENPLHSDVNISWNLSLDDGSPDFQNYAIYYGQDYDSTGASYQFLAEVPSGQNYYVHKGAGYGDPLNYFYYVQANDSSGYPAKNDTQVAKFKQSIQNGWNLISVPLQMRDMSLQNIFNTIVVERAVVYDPLLAGGNWREYNIQKAYQTLDSLTITQGVWIQASQDGNMTIAGVVPHFTAMQLEPGWNLVSYSSFKDRNVSTTLSIIPYDNVETHISGSGPCNLVSMNPSDIMTAGRGYWIDVVGSCVWIVQN